jgi:hypothetical protein
LLARLRPAGAEEVPDFPASDFVAGMLVIILSPSLDFLIVSLTAGESGNWVAAGVVHDTIRILCQYDRTNHRHCQASSITSSDAHLNRLDPAARAYMRDLRI